MLEEVRITGLGVIDDATLDLPPGCTVVTGETGAGKTMVVTGLGLLFGGRADPARGRPGAQRAVGGGRLTIEHSRKGGPEGGAARGRVRAAGRCRCRDCCPWRTTWSPCTASPNSSSCCGPGASARPWTPT